MSSGRVGGASWSGAAARAGCGLAAVVMSAVTAAALTVPTLAVAQSVSVQSTPLAKRERVDGPLFSRMQGNEVGVDQVNDMSPAEFFPPFWNGRGMAAGDVDGDGRHDLVLATRNGVRLYLNRGDWTFEKQALMLGEVDGYSVHVVALADMDGDGGLDLVLTTYANGNFLVTNRDGRFRAADLTRLPASPKVLSKIGRAHV